MKSAAFAAALAFAAHFASTAPVSAISIELKDVAPDRIDRQRKASAGDLPLAGTPDLADLPGRLANAGLSVGDAVFIRIFKAQSELELWMLKDGRFKLFAVYPICYWSGTLGPKVREGDRQTPEGFYVLDEGNLHQRGRWPRSLDLGYPNLFDRAQARNGSYILVHGGCTSIGCFAMTNDVMKEVYDLTEAALNDGQANVPVHVFPFRMTDANVEGQRGSPWHAFWTNLKVGHDAFERTGMPPAVAVCEDRYDIVEVAAGSGRLGPLGVCGEKIEAVELLDRLYKAAMLRPTIRLSGRVDRLRRQTAWLSEIREKRAAAIVKTWSAAARSAGKAERRAERQEFSCTQARPSCRKFIALRRQAAVRVAKRASKKKIKTASRGR